MNTDPELKLIFKSLLTKLNDNFAEKFNEKSVYKNVVRMERKTTSFVEHFFDPEKFQFNVSYFCVRQMFLL